jgi:hypothetical protein
MVVPVQVLMALVQTPQMKIGNPNQMSVRAMTNLTMIQKLQICWKCTGTIVQMMDMNDNVTLLEILQSSCNRIRVLSYTIHESSHMEGPRRLMGDSWPTSSPGRQPRDCPRLLICFVSSHMYGLMAEWL